jgi:hypothetical protein
MSEYWTKNFYQVMTEDMIYFGMTNDSLAVRKRENCFDHADVDLVIDFILQVCNISVAVTKIAKQMKREIHYKLN